MSSRSALVIDPGYADEEGEPIADSRADLRARSTSSVLPEAAGDAGSVARSMFCVSTSVAEERGDGPKKQRERRELALALDKEQGEEKASHQLRPASLLLSVRLATVLGLRSGC